MKKFILLLVGIVLPGLVLADAAAPEIKQYKALIKNRDGVKCEDVTIPYNTEVTVVMEYDEENTTYVDISYKDNYCTLKMNDITLNDEYDLDDYANEFYLYKYVYKKGAYLYKGPSKIYGKVDGNVELPVGMELKLEYFDRQWGFVTYKGISGWVYIYNTPFGDGAGLYEEKTSLANIEIGKIYTLEDITLEDSPYDGKKTDIVIPKGEKIDYRYSYCTNPNAMCSIYLTYNGKSGWYGYHKGDDKKIAYVSEKGSLYILENTIIYEDITLNKKIGELEKDSEVDVLYYQNDYESYYGDNKYYIKSKKIEGWVTIPYEKSKNLVSSNMTDNSYLQALVINPVKVYDSYDMKNEIDTVPKDKRIDLVYSYSSDLGNSYYVREYNGWILLNFNDLELIENFPEIEIKTNNEGYNKEDEENNQIEEEKPKINGKELALYCIGGAIIIALVSLVIIKLVNKKKEI